MNLGRFYTFIGILLTAHVCLTASDSLIKFSKNSLTLELRNHGYVLDISLKEEYDFRVLVNFTYGDESQVQNVTNGIIEQLPQIEFERFESNSTKNVTIMPLKVGHVIIGATSEEVEIPLTDTIRIDIIHSHVVSTLTSIIGWIYFAAWSISFYPQLILNYKRKSVEGLNFDFLSLNFLGHTSYMIFNLALYFNKQVQEEYFKIHVRGVNPVLLNDVLFSIHAVTLTLLTITQCFMYERAGQRVSKVTMGILSILILFLFITGFVLLAITLMKYFPQAYMNFKRKSTEGWSIVNILLDLTGGSLSLVQMFLLAYNFDDWSSIFGSPTKLGLGLFSILFDLVFIIQHYVLYRKKPYLEITGDNISASIQS